MTSIHGILVILALLTVQVLPLAIDLYKRNPPAYPAYPPVNVPPYGPPVYPPVNYGPPTYTSPPNGPAYVRKPTCLKSGTSGFTLALHQSPPNYENRPQGNVAVMPVAPPAPTPSVPPTWSATLTAPFTTTTAAPSAATPASAPATPPSTPTATASAVPAASSLPTCQSDDIKCAPEDERYRTSDGSCNNLKNPSFGQSNRPFLRYIPRKQDLINCGANAGLPNPREVSRIVIRRGEMEVNSRLSLMLMAYGQIVDHDVEQTPPRTTATGDFLDCCAPENALASDCCPINAPADDPFYGQEGRPRCMPFLRSRLVKPAGCSAQDVPDVVNSNTPWVDGSFVYGSDPKRVGELRSFKDGLLATSTDSRKRIFPPVTFNNSFRMEFGDSRGDVHPAATMLTVVFHRNHNRIAKELQNIHPEWNDETLFQEARKINVAIHQHITFTDFIDSLLGTPNNVGVSDQNGQFQDVYDSSLDGAISVGFGTAGFRLHTYVSGNFVLRNEQFEPHQTLVLRDIFHNPLITMANNTYDDLMRGLCGQPLHEFDNVFSGEMTEWLFREKKQNFGLDIAALNVQRGRDHQIHGYATFREFCGLGSAKTWDEMADLIPADLVHRLLHTYQRPEDVDLYIGGNMEAPLIGSILGPTFHCLVREQFERLRNADRFFYTNPGQFSRDQLTTISQQTLARVLCDNADEPQSMALPKNVFNLVDPVQNPLFRCSNFAQHPKLNINAWR